MDALTTITKLKEEHERIVRHVKLVGDSLSDAEAVKSLQGARADWIPGRQEVLAEKQRRLQRTLESLDEGLRNHFALEETELPAVFGDLLMRALTLEHQDVIEALEHAKSTLLITDLQGLTREQLLSQDSQVQQTIDHLTHLIEDHASKEEAMLDMLQRALQKE